jgi:hypothetical protein
MFPPARGCCRLHAANLKLQIHSRVLKTNIYQNSFDSDVRTRGCRKRLRTPESELAAIMINFACPRQESGFMAALHGCNRLDLCVVCHIRMDITVKPYLPHSSAK